MLWSLVGVMMPMTLRSSHCCPGVFPQHPAVTSHRSHKTIGSVEAQREKAEERERQEKEAEEKRKGEIQVTKLWKPFGTTIGLFVTAGKR